MMNHSDTANPQNSPPDKLLVTTEEAFDRISIGRTKGYELLDSGELESVYVGRRRLVVVESLEAFVDRLRRPITEAATA